MVEYLFQGWSVSATAAEGILIDRCAGNEILRHGFVFIYVM